MILTLDHELATTLIAIESADWAKMHKIAHQQNAAGTKEFVLVVSGKLFHALRQVDYITFDYWTIGDLVKKILITEAEGFATGTATATAIATATPNGSHSYRLAVLEALRKFVEDPTNVVWTAYSTGE